MLKRKLAQYGQFPIVVFIALTCGWAAFIPNQAAGFVQVIITVLGVVILWFVPLSPDIAAERVAVKRCHRMGECHCRQRHPDPLCRCDRACDSCHPI